MGIIQGIKNVFTSDKSIVDTAVKEVTAYYNNMYSRILNTTFNGEKTPGELGAARNYVADYKTLRTRSWQSYYESEITQFVINKYCIWAVGTGLKLQSRPEQTVLMQEGINFKDKGFTKDVESRFGVWSNSPISGHSQCETVNQLANEAFKNSIVGGDCLIVLRTDGQNVTVQVIDGDNVVSPINNSSVAAGNRVVYGIEINENGTHIAYHVINDKGTTDRILRVGEQSGVTMAFMVYGSRFRLDSIRGIPLVSVVLETLKKLDRYKEATVGSAEERAKIVLVQENGINSSGENVMLGKIAEAKSQGFGTAPESYPSDNPTKIASTTQKSVVNMPTGSTLKSLEAKNELYFKDFYTTNIQIVCAALGIPAEVAMDGYNGNYSASRAAIKSWDYTLKTAREKFAIQFYQNIYNYWLDIQVYNNKITAKKYVDAILNKNKMALSAYRNSRWLGAPVPHIDPLVEVKAARLALGDEFTPLITYDQVTENLGNGDFEQITEKVKVERNNSKELRPTDNGKNT